MRTSSRYEASDDGTGDSPDSAYTSVPNTVTVDDAHGDGLWSIYGAYGVWVATLFAHWQAPLLTEVDDQ